MSPDTSPEERLLQHIRKKREPHAKTTAADKKKDISGKELPTEKGSGRLLWVLKRALALISILLVGYIGYELVFVAEDVEDVLKAPIATFQDDEFQKIAFAESKPFDYYAQKIQTRDIFESPLYRTRHKDTVSSNAPDLVKNLRLVGIVLDDNPEAIIEDVEAKQTLFLHIGDNIRGATVEEIGESKIILNYNDQQIELTQ